METYKDLRKLDTSLIKMIKHYLKKAKAIDSYLTAKPQEWGKFQPEFNAEVNGIFRNIMDFEKSNLATGCEDKVYKLKQLFVNRLRKIFVRGHYIDWSLRKPYGYAGDFKIIEDIYDNNPGTKGFDRLFDNYFQMSAISIAVRNRKEDFRRFLIDFINNRKGHKLRIMDLASGGCREIRELLYSDNALYKNVSFDCYDNDERSMQYANDLLSNYKNVSFFKENAVRLALKKDINSEIGKKYDLIYSTGLFDYFSERIAMTLVRNLKKLLAPDGSMAIASVKDKYSNPSVHFMEWVGDWNLVYRDEDEFNRIFIDAGFKANELEIKYEQQGVVQYMITHNNK